MAKRLVVSRSVSATTLCVTAASAFAGYKAKEKGRAFENENKFVRVEDLIAEQCDMIEIKRGLFQYWGIYIGDGYIIHLVNSSKTKGRILMEELKEVVGNGMCRVNDLAAAAKDRRLQSRTKNKIFIAVSGKLDQEIDYGSCTYNCEHFATECYYGTGFSMQADIRKQNPLIDITGLQNIENRFGK